MVVTSVYSVLVLETTIVVTSVYSVLVIETTMVVTSVCSVLVIETTMVVTSVYSVLVIETTMVVTSVYSILVIGTTMVVTSVYSVLVIETTMVVTSVYSVLVIVTTMVVTPVYSVLVIDTTTCPPQRSTDGLLRSRTRDLEISPLLLVSGEDYRQSSCHPRLCYFVLSDFTGTAQNHNTARGVDDYLSGDGNMELSGGMPRHLHLQPLDPPPPTSPGYAPGCHLILVLKVSGRYRHKLP